MEKFALFFAESLVKKKTIMRGAGVSTQLRKAVDSRSR